MRNKISITGARKNNLKNISFEIPREKLIVFTGVSGSGKSTIAYDVIYSEGRKRLMDSLSSYERGFMGKVDETDVDFIEGLSPAIAINQKAISRNSRSTVGSLTDLYNYTRLLFSRGSTGICPSCHRKLAVLSKSTIIDMIINTYEGEELEIYSTGVIAYHESCNNLFDELEMNNISTIHYKGKKESIKIVKRDIEEHLKRISGKNDFRIVDKNDHENYYEIIDAYIGKIHISKNNISDIRRIIERSLSIGDGVMRVRSLNEQKHLCNHHDNCTCGIIISQISAGAFSSNTPLGSCPTCTGLGDYYYTDPKEIIPDESKSIADGAINIIGWQYYPDKFFKNKRILEALANKYNFSLYTPFQDLPKEIADIILYGTNDEKITIKNPSYGGNDMKEKFIGIANNISKKFKMNTKRENNSFSDEDKRITKKMICPTCQGNRLKLSRQFYKIRGKSITDFSSMTLYELSKFCKKLMTIPVNELDKSDVIYQVVPNIIARIELMIDLGLGYLSMNRSVTMLSGGEAQRLKLTRQLNSELMGMIYILDEPSAGLHAKDRLRMIDILFKLRNLGNTIIVVEHDDEIIKKADFLVDVGPKAGEHGGEIVALGSIEDIKINPSSLTGQYISGYRKVDVPNRRTKVLTHIEIEGANKNNLKNISVKIPLGQFVGITGVSGSGKSTLINEILLVKILEKLKRSDSTNEEVILKGYENINDVIHIDQREIGRSSRSNPATFIGIFDLIRKLFAETNEAKKEKFKSSHFSFNTVDGQCQYCKGLGLNTIEMQFMADIEILCESCSGTRYNEEVLKIKYKGRNIAEVLQLSVREAKQLFITQPVIYEKLDVMDQMGLGYLRLGQAATTLSGGEAQRLKLAKELDRLKGKCNNLYILDEPTSGLHIDDVKKLIAIFQKLVDAGNSVIVIEHNMHMIKTVDYIIDLGPDGGDYGGEVVATGTPEELIHVKSSYTGQYLSKILKPS